MKVRDLLFRNFLTKIVSLLFAVILWFVVIGEKQAQIQLDIPLEVVNIPGGMVLVSDIPSIISVQVQGPRTVVRTLTGRGIRKSIDLKGMVVGWTTIRILPDSIPLPRGIEVLRVTPSTLELKLEPALEVNLPVSPQVSGDPPRGYRIQEIVVDPPEVVLKGGEGELRELKAVKTQPVNVSEATTDVEEKVGLELQGLHLLDASPTKVWVRLNITQVLVERKLEGVPVQWSPSDIMKTTVQPDKVLVVVKGPVEIIDDIRVMDIQVSMELEGLEPGDHRVSPTVAAPDGIRVVDVEPSMLKVSVERPSDAE
jgi:YbbR domain-containing protein